MKTFIFFFILSILFFTYVEARTLFTKGKIYEGTIHYTDKIKYELPPGKWEAADRWGWNILAIEARGVTLVKTIDNKIDEVIGIYRVSVNGSHQSYLFSWINEIMFNSVYDGCYERPEYYILKRKRKGAFFNCFWASHQDVHRDLYTPDDPSTHVKVSSAVLRKYIRDNNLELPRIFLYRDHCFFAPSVTDTLYCFGHSINPETQGGPKNKFLTEETSEYYVSNIESYPEHKKFMEEWVEYSAKEHKKFEKSIKAKKKHLIDFSEYNISEEIKHDKKSNESNNLIDDLKKLNDLYESGALTKEEFEKAKKKILN